MRPLFQQLLLSLLCFTACRTPTAPGGAWEWAQLETGEHYSCALSGEAHAFCWGGVGGYYEIPSPLDSIIPNAATPWHVPGDHRFIDITSGGLVMCALDVDRRAFCWGGNTLGEVGDGTSIAKRGPSAVVGGMRWKVIDAGGAHVCGISIDDVTYCWGNNFRGALGLGDGTMGGASPRPLRVSGGITFANVRTTLGTSCALTPEGDGYCWGVNDYGMLGDGETPEPFKESDTPVRVVGGHRFASLALGGAHVCAIRLDAQAYCWGWNRYGQLGDGTDAHSSTPVLVQGNRRWSSLSAGEFHTCGLATDGATYCWGANDYGQLGDGTTTAVSSPRLIAPAGVYVQIGAGGRHTCARKADGTAFCWGRGDFGQLGHGFMKNELRPVQVNSPR